MEFDSVPGLTLLLWTPIVAALLWLAWSTFRWLYAMYWLYFVFRPAVIRLLEELFPDETSEALKQERSLLEEAQAESTPARSPPEAR